MIINIKVDIDRIGIPDQFIEHGNVDQLLEEINVTAEETVKRINALLKKAGRFKLV